MIFLFGEDLLLSCLWIIISRDLVSLGAEYSVDMVLIPLMLEWSDVIGKWKPYVI